MASKNHSHSHKSLYSAFIILLVLLVITVAANFAPLGAAHTWFGMGIATVKTFIVVVVFMGLMRTPAATKLAAAAGFLWLTFAVVLVMADYATRGWDETQGHRLEKADHFTTFDKVEYSDVQKDSQSSHESDH